MLNPGFYCALGTPLDKRGNLLPESLSAHIESQIQAGASGLLLMGTMGMLGCIPTAEYEPAVQAAVKAVGGRVPLLVGAADNSLARVRDRIEVLNRYPVSVVLTAPYYFSLTRDCAMRYFRESAAMTTHDVYLYDHPFTARHKLSLQDVIELAAIPNIKGIKTGDAVLVKTLHDLALRDDFTPIFSNSDLFAVGRAYGVCHVLDGIFGCFPATISRAQKAFDAGDFERGKGELNAMMAARDDMFVMGIWPAFSYAMNLLGFEGNFAPDYEPALKEEDKPGVRAILKRLGEL